MMENFDEFERFDELLALEDSITRGGGTSEEWEGSGFFIYICLGVCKVDHLLCTVSPDSILPQLQLYCLIVNFVSYL